MAYKITPKERETHQAIDVPLHRFGGEAPAHHRVKTPQGHVIPKEGIVVDALDPHYTRQRMRGEVEIVEGTVERQKVKVDDQDVERDVFVPKGAAAKPAPAAEAPSEAREPHSAEKTEA